MSDTEDRRKKSDDEDNTLPLYGLAAVVAFVLAVPTLLGFALFLLGRRLGLRRLEYIVVGLVGLLALAWNWSWLLGGYTDWLLSFFPGRELRLLPPALPSLVFAVPVASLFGLIAGTSVGEKLPGKALGEKRSILDQESLIPNANEKRRVDISQPDGLLVSAADHSVTGGAGKPGDRNLPLGRDKHGKTVGITEKELGMHMLVMGSTGSGKTVTLQTLSTALMDLGWRGLVLDLKESGDLEDYFGVYTRTHAIPFQSLMLSDAAPSYWLNPLLGMRADSALDALMMTQRYGDNAAYYEAINRKMAAQALNLLYDAHEADPQQFPYPAIGDLGRLIAQGANLPQASKKMVASVLVANPSRTKEDYSSLVKPNQTEAEAASGLGTRLTNMLETAAGRTILRPSAERPPLDVTMDGLTYIGLDTQGRPEMSQVLAGFVLQRMAVYAADRTIQVNRGNAPRPKFLIIDEANQVKARPIILTLLQKARQAGITVILATQSPTDWIDEIGNDWDSMSQNCNVSVIMSQNAARAAELCADLLGKERKVSAGLQYLDGEVYDAGSLRESEEYRVSPDQLTQLSIGEAIIKVGKPNHRVVWTKVAQRDPTAHAGGVKSVAPHPALRRPDLGGSSGGSPSGPDTSGGSIGSQMPTPGQ